MSTTTVITLIQLVLVLQLLPKEFESASLGIDFGNEFNKASTIAPGKMFAMVENKISKRKSPSYLTFLENSRFNENPAENKSIKTLSNSFYFMNKFYGKCQKDNQELKDKIRSALLQDFEIECDEFGTLFTLKDFQLDLSNSVFQDYKKRAYESGLVEVRNLHFIFK